MGLFKDLKELNDSLENINRVPSRRRIKRLMALINQFEDSKTHLLLSKKKFEKEFKVDAGKFENRFNQMIFSFKNFVFPVVRHLIHCFRNHIPLERKETNLIEEIERDLEESISVCFKCLEQMVVIEKKFLDSDFEEDLRLGQIQKATSWIEGAMDRSIKMLNIARERIEENSKIIPNG